MGTADSMVLHIKIPSFGKTGFVEILSLQAVYLCLFRHGLTTWSCHSSSN